MIRYVLARVIVSLPMVLLLAVLTFSLLRLSPGDPALIMLGVRDATPEAIAAVHKEYGLDAPIPIQFGVWLGKVLQGNLGSSITTRTPVSELIAARIPVTLELAAAALVLSALVGIPLGVGSALNQGRPYDSVGRFLSLVGVCVPSFVVGILFVMMFGWYLPGILPYEHWVAIKNDVGQNLLHLILPATALALGPIGIVARLVRSSMLDVLGRDYITMARAFGIPRAWIVWLDTLKNALLPVISALGVIGAYLVSGAVVIETIFSIPGLGRLLTDGLQNRDYPLVSGDLLILSMMVLLGNLCVDLIYGWVNPRIAQRYREGR